MNIFGDTAGSSRSRVGGRILGSLLSLALVFATLPQNLWAYQDQDAAAPAQDAAAPAQDAAAPAQDAAPPAQHAAAPAQDAAAPAQDAAAPAQDAAAPAYTQQTAEQL